MGSALQERRAPHLENNLTFRSSGESSRRGVGFQTSITASDGEGAVALAEPSTATCLPAAGSCHARSLTHEVAGPLPGREGEGSPDGLEALKSAFRGAWYSGAGTPHRWEVRGWGRGVRWRVGLEGGPQGGSRAKGPWARPGLWPFEMAVPGRGNRPLRRTTGPTGDRRTAAGHRVTVMVTRLLVAPMFLTGR